MKLFLLTFLVLDKTLGKHFNNYSPPPNPPGVPLNACKIFIPYLCDSLLESNYFDVNCYSNDDPYGGLGCNAGGLICCRFCEFSQYINIPCILSPSLPPSPFPPPSPPPSPPPLNPLIISIGDSIVDPNKAKINFHMRLNSNIETIDIDIFENKILNILKNIAERNQVIFNFRPGSLLVDISIITNITLVENTTNFIDAITTSDLSEQINITIVEMTPAIVERYSYDNSDEKSNYEKVYMSAILVCSGLILCLLWCTRNRVTVISNKFIENVNTIRKNINKTNENLDDFKVNRLSGVSVFIENTEKEKKYYDC
tara:strand:+ start:8936 stop:9874 length:939 start_codon:yes stop_codon:yes gene_type:complete